MKAIRIKQNGKANSGQFFLGFLWADGMHMQVDLSGHRLAFFGDDEKYELDEAVKDLFDAGFEVEVVEVTIS